jgi:hypothetical protein
MRGCSREGVQVIAGLLLASVTAIAAPAADKVRVGKSVTQPFAFAPIEIGLEKGHLGAARARTRSGHIRR